jgi:fructose-bisphosphate aldolase / 2-amino-3,7-dideoxy-D-threo-hept-6-ulosonate synthase
MSEIGKKVRLSQIFHKESGTSVIIAMDHGTVIGPVKGIVDPINTIKTLCEAKPDTFFMPNGIFKLAHSHFIENRVPFIISLDTCTFMGPDPDYFMLSDSVEHALNLGASGVSMHVLIGPSKTSDMIKGLAKVSEICDSLGMPLLAIMYPWGYENDFDVEKVKWAARIAAELGADIVKTFYTGSKETFKEVVGSCPIPVLLSGGDFAKAPEDFLKVLKNTIDAGGHGCAVGRNVWQYKNPKLMVNAIKKIVHEKSTVEDALLELKL